MKVRAGVATPIWRRVVIHTDVDWMKRVGCRGIVIGRHILFSDAANRIPPHIWRHELEHVYQQIREGVLFFYLKYFIFSLRYGYQNNPFEVEAREKQHLPLTANEEQLLWKLREGLPRSLAA